MLRKQSRLAGPIWATLMIATALALAGCTSGSNETSPTSTIEQATTTVPTTTTGPATTTEDPNLAEVMVAYEGHLTYLPIHGATADEQLLAEYAAGPLLERLVDRYAGHEADGKRVGDGQYLIHVLDIEMDDDVAFITSCNLDGVSLLSATGEELIPPDVDRYLRITELKHLKQGWRVIETTFEGGVKTECDP
jgi:hypothetical protein